MSDAGWWQACVRAFHEKMGVKRSDRYRLHEMSDEEIELRLNLILEEVDELVTACGAGIGRHAKTDKIVARKRRRIKVNEKKVIDALCDLRYVECGLCDVAGIPLERFYEAVHRSNMTKTPGNLREDGKILKGPEYEPPQLELMLERMKERGR